MTKVLFIQEVSQDDTKVYNKTTLDVIFKRYGIPLVEPEYTNVLQENFEYNDMIVSELPEFEGRAGFEAEIRQFFETSHHVVFKD